jgi:EAL domain-containing protein (putative c-di-GMP-specific phosphodiesterase class I)
MSLRQGGGNALLKETAFRLHSMIRKDDILAHLEEDRFGLLFENIQDTETAEEIARRTQEQLSIPIVINQKKIHLMVSMGICISAKSSLTEEDYIRNAETAMNLAKSMGGGRYLIYDHGMRNQSVYTLQMKTDLRQALENSEFELYYQPLVSLKDRSIAGFEALCRWRHPTRGFVPPTEFIPMAEKTGIISELGNCILNHACKQLAEWHAAGHDKITVAINFSVLQLNNEDLPNILEKALKENKIPPSSLEIEITESVAVKDFEKTVCLLTKFKDMGIKIAIDDFGTRYSSLSYLQEFPLDKLKIDQTFVRNVPRDSKNVSIVNTVIALANSLNLTVIAEGVETPEELAFLEEAGCHHIQGYLFGRPRDTASTTKLLEQGTEWLKTAYT